MTCTQASTLVQSRFFTPRTSASFSWLSQCRSALWVAPVLALFVLHAQWHQTFTISANTESRNSSSSLLISRETCATRNDVNAVWHNSHFTYNGYNARTLQAYALQPIASLHLRTARLCQTSAECQRDRHAFTEKLKRFAPAIARPTPAGRFSCSKTGPCSM